MSTDKNKNGLLPETEYRAWDKEPVALRSEAHKAMIHFNTTGDKQVLKELFQQPLDDVSIAPPMHCNYGGDRIRFGHRVFINANCTFQPAGGVEIGDDVYIGSDVKFYTTIHPTEPEERIKGKASVRPIRIGAKVCIGGGVVILPGVEIGEGTTVGAGSVVTRSIPARCVAVGNPCWVIRKL
ncbi:sugar O-acetyltransferase [Palleniella muris]|uniref:Sugar O-acetyltransferase n=1 Tax=Palleniella muris TaxID=3038145 RepID=A0AC61QNR7_9BACT|nr:sugar O-acetyltransferase [Palleniella muris]TGX81321.1 sugar O-acetyltransferase [Palleniella muris]